MGRTIALATPVFFALIALELAVGRVRGNSNYRLNDALNSLGLGVMSQVTALFTRLLAFGIYAAVYSSLAVWSLPQDEWWVWALAIVAYDICYYWNHRLGHESAVFWASHVVHHQSQEYNLSTALRQTSSGALLGWVFYLPMAVAGFPPQVFLVAAIVDLLYQYWIHTEQVGKLGWFDRWFASPSNHRVHHAVNDRYLDRNYGGILMIWDRLFGTFVEEDEKCVYGTRAPLESWDPLWANVEVYADLARKSWRATRWRDKLAVWLKPPGWQPAGLAGGGWRGTPFDLSRVRRFDPVVSRTARAVAVVHFVAALLASLPLLWYAQEMSMAERVAAALAIVVLLWISGALMQGRLAVRPTLTVEFALAALVIAARVASAEPAGRATIQPDPQVQRAVEAARSEFLAGQPFDRLQLSVLVEGQDGRWRRGSVGGRELVYPASCVKLAFLVAAVHWCAGRGLGPDCLDAHVRPMIVDSDNVATGVVVDTISAAPNRAIGEQDAGAWIARRLYTENLLDGAGLLQGQRLFTKTYPTNSGDEPSGLERLAWQSLGRNAMSADAAGELMLAIVGGTIEPAARSYMRGLLRRPTFSPHSALGGGLPPGSLHENKVGSAFDTLQDIVHAELPNGRRLIVAAFSNGLDPRDPPPWDVARLGQLAELLVARLQLAEDLPVPGHPAPRPDGAGGYTWSLSAPQDGLYELAAWYESSDAAPAVVHYAIEHDAGILRVQLDQQVWGRRWIRLGDLHLRRGTGTVRLSAGVPGQLDPGRIRMTRWAQDASRD